MPAKNPRVNVVLEKPLYSSVLRAAARDGVSVSTKVRDLVREAMESSEDRLLAQIANDRDANYDKQSALTHEQVFGRPNRKLRT